MKKIMLVIAAVILSVSVAALAEVEVVGRNTSAAKVKRMQKKHTGKNLTGKTAANTTTAGKDAQNAKQDTTAGNVVTPQEKK